MKWLLSLDRLVEADVLVLDLFPTSLQGRESRKAEKGLVLLWSVLLRNAQTSLWVGVHQH